MRAGAMEGDREKCLAASMDDYLAKPIARVDLAIALKRWIVGDKRSEAESDTIGEAAILDSDIVTGLSQLDRGKKGVVAGLVSLFVEDTNTSMEVIARAIQERDGTTVAMHAHRLRGSSGSLGAATMARLCGELESAPPEDFEDQLRVLELVEAEFERTTVALKRQFKA